MSHPPDLEALVLTTPNAENKPNGNASAKGAKSCHSYNWPQIASIVCSFQPTRYR